MAAQLHDLTLRGHALPATVLVHLDHAARRTARAPSRSAPALTASWHVGLDGRLACTWSATPDDPG